MDNNQKIKNRLGSIYISLMLFIGIGGVLFLGITIVDIVVFLLSLTLFILLQKKLVKLNTLCILSIIVGAIGVLCYIVVLHSLDSLYSILLIWLVIYSIISLVKIKDNIDI